MSDDKESLLKTIKKLEKKFGPGITVSVTNTGEGESDYYYSNDVSTEGLPSNIEEVEILSIEHYDEILLHSLLNETKKSQN